MKAKHLHILLLLILFTSCNVLRSEEVQEMVEATATTDPGVVIMGVRWATRNVDVPGTFAESPSDAGMFFQWNRRHGWNIAEAEILGWNRSIPHGRVWSRENDPCPEGWRVPTIFEFELLGQVESAWVMENGVPGRRFGSRHNSIFLPAVGFRATSDGRLLSSASDVSLSNVISAYWSSNEPHRNRRNTQPINQEIAFALRVSREGVSLVPNRRNGFNVRCVARD